ncbi:MAG: 4-hydroxy-tetrahydrodipicolinate reductase [Bacteroidota bacterium]
MTIALVGYGKMGKEVDRLAVDRGWSVSLRMTSRSTPPSEKELAGIDVGIHFAHPSSVLESVAFWTRAGKRLVIGTTGWTPSLGEVQRMVEKAGTGMIYGANFSPGVHLFTRIVQEAASLIDKFPEYDAAIREAHHAQKADSPSGTALMLGNVLLERIRRKTEILTTPVSARIAPHQLQIASQRVGAVVGTHSLLLDSLSDTIELTHNAKNRSGFALGALLAAQWISTRTGVHTVEEMMTDLMDH